MPKNPNSKEGPFLARSRGTLHYVGPIPDYGTVTNDSTTPVQSNRTNINGPLTANETPVFHAGPRDGTDSDRPRGKVRSVRNR